jgi:site-specific recombinase XerD
MQRDETAEARDIPAEIEEAIASFLRGLIAADYSLRSISASSIDLGQFAAFLAERGVMRPGAIDRTDVSDFAASLVEVGSGVVGRAASPPKAVKPYARSTIARKLSVIRSFLGFCEDNGLLDTSPGAGVGSPRVPRRLPQVLTPEQTAGLLETIACR